jgi:hypothetical protein
MGLWWDRRIFSAEHFWRVQKFNPLYPLYLWMIKSMFFWGSIPLRPQQRYFEGQADGEDEEDGGSNNFFICVRLGLVQKFQ